MAQHHELIARLNDVEAPLTSFGDQLTEGCVVLHVNDRPSHHASLLRLLGVEDLVDPCAHGVGRSYGVKTTPGSPASTRPTSVKPADSARPKAPASTAASSPPEVWGS